MKIKGQIEIQDKNTVNILPNWQQQDYLNILDLLGFGEEVSSNEVEEMTLMALADQAPEESAQLLLQYRLGDHLTEGQIEQLSHEMQEDKVAEEYPDIFLQKDLFDINQLLFKAFNGKFPNCKAVTTTINLTVQPITIMQEEEHQHEIILKAINSILGAHSIISRLYEEEIKGLKAFTAAKGILWFTKITAKENAFNVALASSEYWLQDLPSQGTFEFSFELAASEETHA